MRLYERLLLSLVCLMLIFTGLFILSYTVKAQTVQLNRLCWIEQALAPQDTTIYERDIFINGLISRNLTITQISTSPSTYCTNRLFWPDAPMSYTIRLCNTGGLNCVYGVMADGGAGPYYYYGNHGCRMDLNNNMAIDLVDGATVINAAKQGMACIKQTIQ